MANSTVKIVAGSLAGNIIDNAASESTLKELLAAIERLEQASGTKPSTSGSATTDPSAAIGSLISKMNPLAGAALNIVNGFNALGNALGKTFRLLSEGNGNISDYAKVAGELASKLPYVGETIGKIAPAIVFVLQRLEAWNVVLKDLSNYGAAFGNSIVEMRTVSARAFLSLEDFAKIIKENSEGLIALGGTVTEGAQKFAKMNGAMFASGGVGENLINMGMTIEQVSGGFMKFLSTTMKGSKIEEGNMVRMTELYGEYASNLDKLSKLTGKSKESMEEAAKIAELDAAYQMEMAKLSDEGRAKMSKGLQEFIALYGKDGAQIYKEFALTGTVITRNSQLLASAVPGIMTDLDKTHKLAKNNLVSQDQFNEESDRIMANQLASYINNYGSIEGALKAGAAGVGGITGDMYKALQGITSRAASMQSQMKQGEKISAETILANTKAAKDEQNKHAQATKTIDQFNLAVKKIYNGVIEGFAPVINLFIESFKLGDLSKSTNEFSEKVSNFMKEVLPPIIKFFKDEALPAIQNFLTNLTSEEGRDLIKEKIKLMFDDIILSIRRWLGQSFFGRRIGGLKEEDAKKEEQKLKDRESKLESIQQSINLDKAKKESAQEIAKEEQKLAESRLKLERATTEEARKKAQIEKDLAERRLKEAKESAVPGTIPPPEAPAASAGPVKSGPVKSGPQDVKENMELVAAALKRQGMTDPKYIAATLGNVMKETGGKSVEENLNYGKTSNERIRRIFGSRAAGKSDAELDAIKGDPTKMAEMVYGSTTKKGREMGNTEPGDGWKYRGRGFIQLTGKSNYAAASKAIYGDDRLVKTPELLNDPRVAAEVSAWYMKSGRTSMAKKMGFDVNNLTQEQANLLATSQIAGRDVRKSSDFLKNEVMGTVTKYSSQFSAGEGAKIIENTKPSQVAPAENISVRPKSIETAVPPVSVAATPIADKKEAERKEAERKEAEKKEAERKESQKKAEPAKEKEDDKSRFVKGVVTESTLNDVVAEIRTLNMQVGKLLSQNEDLGRAQVKAIKSNSENIYDR